MLRSPIEAQQNNPNAQLYSEISLSVENSLASVSGEKNIDPSNTHSQRVCGDVSDLMISDMRALGHDVFRDRRIALVDWEYDSNGDPLPIEEQNGFGYVHYYVKFPSDKPPEDEVIADATWQQFIPEDQRTDDLPKALIGTRREVHNTLLGLGFTDKDLFKIWDPQE